MCDHGLCYVEWIMPLLYYSDYYTQYRMSANVLKCVFKYPAWVKRFPHCLHSYGFSPVWDLKWIFKDPARLKHFPHCLHSYGFSPVWILSCFRNVPAGVKLLSHCLRSCGFPLELVCLRSYNFPFILRYLLHYIFLPCLHSTPLLMKLTSVSKCWLLNRPETNFHQDLYAGQEIFPL